MEKLNQLLRALSKGGLLSGTEIRKELGISQPAMSRLIREAGPRVSRFGQSVATRYALPREIASLGHQQPVFRVDESGRLHKHGDLHFLAGGGNWLERESGDSQFFSGCPPFVEDMRPQGYIGRGFSTHYPELRLPGRVVDWSIDQQLTALAMRGEDCVGNLIVGEESTNRYLAGQPQSHTREDYPSLATGSLADQPGSSAGGEHPKFAVSSGDRRHLLVKFASGEGEASERWRDLLICEHIALEVLREAGIPSSHSEWFDLNENRYLEVERFDRVNARGRRGTISLSAVYYYYLGGNLIDWSSASQQILKDPSLSMSPEHADQMVWLDTFGDLIGNTDRHFGNFSFFAEEARELTLSPTPVYDMLPMVFAPSGTNMTHRTFTPKPPTVLNLSLWHQVSKHAIDYWSRLCVTDALSSGFRKICQASRDTLSQLIREQS